jgi:hypothetical protein
MVLKRMVVRERKRECIEKDHIVAGSKSSYIREKGFHHLSGGV